MLALLGAGSTLVVAASFYLYLSPKLPSAESLRTVDLQTPLRVYSSDGLLMGEFGEKRRTPVTFHEIPEAFIQAILAAEDDRFYHHNGVDITGLLRAALELVTTGSIQSGGSTITMQVARNFFLTSEQSFVRKFNEILLAIRIEDELTKSEILTLYANKIYLGSRAYGVEAAAQVYYGRHIGELRLDQLAMIAGLPKAPSAFNPLVNPERAKTRRDWILRRMYKLRHIDQTELDGALNAPMDVSYHGPAEELKAPYLAEMARQEVIDRYGLKAYTEGYRVYTTLDSKLQGAADSAVRKGLEEYDIRHGYRGPERHIEDPQKWKAALADTKIVGGFLPGIVQAVEKETAMVLLHNGDTAALKLADDDPIRQFITENARSAPVSDFTELWQPGDLIRVWQSDDGGWRLGQVPKVQGALVALDPADGAIRALVGGYDFGLSHFNRATQAQRQPGSNFKPFIYLHALERGMTAATLINDAPIVFDDPGMEDVWRPENDSGKFYGPTRLRQALYLSRNLVSIRILRQIGIQDTISSMARFGFDTESLPANLSLALGTQATTPLKIASGYTVFANGGYKVDPYLIDRIESEDGDILFQARPDTVCHDCERAASPRVPGPEVSSLEELFALDDAPENHRGGEADGKIPPKAKRIVDARIAYIMDSILRDTIKRGTGRKARALNRSDIGGKTGTTNGPRDAWFSGYSPHLTTSVWVGFDSNDLLGRNEYGGSAALPIWIDFMEVALADKPDRLRPQPSGLVTARIDPETGQQVGPGFPGAEFEYFLSEQMPVVQGDQTERVAPQQSSGKNIPDNLF